MFLLHPACMVRDTAIHCAMPEHLRKTNVRSVWADANRGGRAVDSFLEGPVVDASGNLYVTDIPFGRIFRITPSLAWEVVAEYGGEPNGMKFLDDEHLVVTDYRNGLMRVDIAKRRGRAASSSVAIRSGSRASTTSCSTRAAICISPTRARPE